MPDPTSATAPELRLTPPPRRRIPVGLELYSVRNELARDLPGTLRTVAEQGYEAVEFYAPYCQWTTAYATDVRRILDDLGLRCHSTHNDFAVVTPGETMDRALALNEILGSCLVVVAMPPPGLRDHDGWKRVSDDFAAASTWFARRGLAAGFHNHEAEWHHLAGGLRVMDVIAAHTPREFVLQLDVGACVAAGADPVAWIEAHPGRIRSVHLKDWTPGTREDEKGFRVLLGEGVCPWREVCAAAEAVGGVEVYLIEQEGSRYPELETAARCLAAWRGFGR